MKNKKKITKIIPIKKPVKSKLKKKLKNKAWKLMSEYIRKKGADKKGYNSCYTCGIIKHWKELHAGHRHHNKLDCDERNIKPQCCKCNTWEHGNLGNYERKLIEEYGIDWCKQLEKDAWTKGNNYSTEELEKIIIDLEKKLCLIYHQQ